MVMIQARAFPKKSNEFQIKPRASVLKMTVDIFEESSKEEAGRLTNMWVTVTN